MERDTTSGAARPLRAPSPSRAIATSRTEPRGQSAASSGYLTRLAEREQRERKLPRSESRPVGASNLCSLTRRARVGPPRVASPFVVFERDGVSSVAGSLLLVEASESVTAGPQG